MASLILNELFDTVLPWKWSDRRSTSSANFELDLNGQVYRYNIELDHGYDPKVVDVAFGVRKPGESSMHFEPIHMDRSGFKVYSTLVAIIMDYMKNHPHVHTLTFEGYTKEQTALYHRMASRLVSRMGSEWRVERDDKQTILTRNDAVEETVTEDVLEEGLIAIPPKMLQQMKFLLSFHVLWWARDRWKGKEKELPAQYAAFKKLYKEFGEKFPPKPYKVDKDLAMSRLAMNLQDLPQQYDHLEPDVQSIIFAINWKVGGQNFAVWNTKHHAIVVFPLAIDYLARYPYAGSHPDDLETALDTMEESMTHELRHMVQQLIIQHPDQMKRKTGYEKHDAEYFTSPVELDPMIGSCVNEFMQYVARLRDAGQTVNLKLRIRQYTGMVPAGRFDMFSTSPLFKHLKAEAPERYKTAVSKFIVELEKRLLKPDDE